MTYHLAYWRLVHHFQVGEVFAIKTEVASQESVRVMKRVCSYDKVRNGSLASSFAIAQIEAASVTGIVCSRQAHGCKGYAYGLQKVSHLINLSELRADL